MKTLKEYLKLIRLKHYIKNVLIFAPLFFSGNFFNTGMLYQGIKLFFAFSFIASFIYIVNDIVDRDKDRLHPQKKNRPIASNKISIKRAVLISAICLLLAGILSVGFPPKVFIIFGIYIATNFIYSFWLKNVVIVDIFLVASMYLMRISIGGALWDITLSHWIVLCTFFFALFIVTAKRRAEFVTIGAETSTRKVMRDYDKGFLDTILTITTTSCIVTYGLYVLSIDKQYLIYSLFFVTFSMLRYLYLVYKKDHGQYPENSLSDFWIGFGVAGWIVYNSIVFYFF